VNKEAPTLGRILVIVGFALSCFGLLVYLWLAFGGPIPLGPKGYRVKAAFPDAAALAQQADVRVAGVNVGKVVALERAPEGNRTLATLEIDERFTPPRRDARALLRQKTLLGETYIEMSLGTRDAPILPDGGRLADARVAPVVEFDEFLRTFDRPTRVAFQQWQRSLAAASRGRALDINDALGNLPVFVEEAGGVVATLRRRREALGSLVRGTGTTFAAITRNEGALQQLIDRNTRVFETLAGRRDALAETFQVFPTFLRESRRTLRRVETFARDTEPLVRDLEPVLEDTGPTLRSLRRLSPDARRFFADLDPLIAAGDAGLPALADVLRGLDPTLAATGPFLQQLNPILEFLELNQGKLSDFLNVGPSALAITPPKPPGRAGAETNGHALPQLIVTGSQTLPANERRSPDNRGNSYFQPDGVDYGQGYKDGFFVYPNWDCDHVGGPRRATDAEPGCFVQGPIPFQGEPLRRYPHVEPAGPGGIPRGQPR